MIASPLEKRRVPERPAVIVIPDPKFRLNPYYKDL